MHAQTAHRDPIASDRDAKFRAELAAAAHATRTSRRPVGNRVVMYDALMQADAAHKAGEVDTAEYLVRLIAFDAGRAVSPVALF